MILRERDRKHEKKIGFFLIGKDTHWEVKTNLVIDRSILTLNRKTLKMELH